MVIKFTKLLLCSTIFILKKDGFFIFYFYEGIVGILL